MMTLKYAQIFGHFANGVQKYRDIQVKYYRLHEEHHAKHHHLNNFVAYCIHNNFLTTGQTASPALGLQIGIFTPPV